MTTAKLAMMQMMCAATVFAAPNCSAAVCFALTL